MFFQKKYKPVEFNKNVGGANNVEKFMLFE